MVNDHRAGRQSPQRVMNHRAHVIIGAHANGQNLAVRGSLGDARARPAAVHGDPSLRFGVGAIEHAHLMASGGEVPGHRAAHDPQPDKTHLHALNLPSHSRRRHTPCARLSLGS